MLVRGSIEVPKELETQLPTHDGIPYVVFPVIREIGYQASWLPVPLDIHKYGLYPAFSMPKIGPPILPTKNVYIERRKGQDPKKFLLRRKEDYA